VSRPLVLHEPTAAAATPTTPVRYGIGGDPIELHQNLYACLRVGRMDRASAILQRLSDMYNPSAPEVVDAHNIYLQTMFELAEQSPSENSMAELREWYNTRMVANGIEPNAQTFVTLLRASMTLLDQEHQEDAVRKLLAMAHEAGPEVLEGVNGSPDFSDEEWDTLIKLQSDKYEAPPAVEAVQEMEFSTPGGLALAIQHGFMPDPALSVKPVAQKGLGLTSLKQALGVFEPGNRVAYPEDMEGTQEEKDLAYAYMRQIRMEQDSLEAATERWKAEDTKLQQIGIHGVLHSKPIQALMWNWYSAMVPKLEAEIKRVKEVLAHPSTDNVRDDRHRYGTYIESLSPKKLAAMSISSLLGSVAASQRVQGQGANLKLTVLALKLGNGVEELYTADVKERRKDWIRKARKQTRQDLLTKLTKEKATVSNDGHPGLTADLASDAFQHKDFPSQVKARLGIVLLDYIMQSSMITLTREDPKTGKQLSSTQSAFHYQSNFVHGKKVVFVVPHTEVVKKLRNEPVDHIPSAKLPMLVEPKPWTGFEEGGYYTLKEPVIRVKGLDASQSAYAISAIENGDMKQVLAGLDTLGKVPWKINRDVFNVMLSCWNAGENVGGLVPDEPDLRRPAEPPADAPTMERVQYFKLLKHYENTKQGLHSQKCFQNFQLEVARAFANEEKIYYPHSIDFRGRAYPIPPLLNHIGADLSRGLLLFANGKELGNVGLQWLKVHLANLYGYDKASLKDREQFAMDNIEHIYDSANNPLDGNRWWTKAEDPWQCLACCIELKNALSSPDPTRYVSHLPVHQDGTCNGLQHYAALGGDSAGASQVNLEPSDKPQDIYTGVAEMVREMVAEDAKKGEQYGLFMDGKITRSVVKRTVMTNVYGVTFTGAKLQVLDELKSIFPNFEPQGKVYDLSALAAYVARKIFLALGRIFNGAQEIQSWLGECGDRITSSLSAEQVQRIKERFEGKPVGYDSKYNKSKKLSERLQKKIEQNMDTFKTSIIWTTPLKMPVVQPYRKDSNKVIKTGHHQVTVASSARGDEVNKRKQLQAFPPNFIHSLDATHMILSALKCAELGIDFAAVHDSFWTHAADIPNLNVVLRDAFVRMHSEDIIGRLHAEFHARYAGAMYRATLHPDTPVAQEIANWRSKQGRKAVKGLSKNRSRVADITEVALEAQRQELLKSEDPEERKKGEEMVTPTSIWLKHADPLSLASTRLAILGDKKRTGGKADEVNKKILAAETEPVKELAASLGAEPIEEAGEAVEEGKGEEDVDAELELEEGEERATKGSSKAANNLRVWLPLTFPPIPKKGDWDVKRLHQSKYFFS
jgi:DNA-directed RNA polymerase